MLPQTITNEWMNEWMENPQQNNTLAIVLYFLKANRKRKSMSFLRFSTIIDTSYPNKKKRRQPKAKGNKYALTFHWRIAWTSGYFLGILFFILDLINNFGVFLFKWNNEIFSTHLGLEKNQILQKNDMICFLWRPSLEIWKEKKLLDRTLRSL